MIIVLMFVRHSALDGLPRAVVLEIIAEANFVREKRNCDIATTAVREIAGTVEPRFEEVRPRFQSHVPCWKRWSENRRRRRC
jgi:hypothetical protein